MVSNALLPATKCRGRGGYMKGLAARRSQSFFITFRPKTQIDAAQLRVFAGFLDDFREQPQAGRILLKVCGKCRLIPKPASAELEAVVPSHGLRTHHQSRKCDPARCGQ